MDQLLHHLTDRRARRLAGAALVVLGIVLLVHEALSLSWWGTVTGAGVWGLGVLVAWRAGWMEEDPDEAPRPDPDPVHRVRELARSLRSH